MKKYLIEIRIALGVIFIGIALWRLWGWEKMLLAEGILFLFFGISEGLVIFISGVLNLWLGPRKIKK